MQSNSRFLLAGLLITLTTATQGSDWPQWRGPLRNGISTERNWNASWPKEGPKQLSKAKVGVGYSTEGSGRIIESRWCLPRSVKQNVTLLTDPRASCSAI